jgi:hypothetical protein
VLTWLLPIGLVAGGLAMMAWHMSQWRASLRQATERRRLELLRRRFRLRMQSSGLMVAIGVAMLAAGTIDRRVQPSLYVYAWVGIVLLVLWMLLLAVADIVLTRE